MSLGQCQICKLNEAIGVYSTSVPLSLAYCAECVRQGADPEYLMKYFLDDVANGDPSQIQEGIVTYSNGKYVTFHEWAKVELEKRNDQP